MKISVSSILAAAAMFVSTQAQALIITLDATDSMNAQTVSLEAGDYSVDLIEGNPTAWSAWSSNNGCGAVPGDCARGFINRFFVESFDLGVLSAGSTSLGERYDTALAAINVFGTFEFSLPTAQDVTFGIRDAVNFGDNRGGLNLEITRVSEPATLALLGLGLVGVAATRRRS